MGLIKETNAAYYSGQIVLKAISNNKFKFGNTKYGFGFNTELVSAFDQNGNQVNSFSNYDLINLTTSQTLQAIDTYVSDTNLNELSLTSQSTASINIGDFLLCQLKQEAVENNYGSYSYISLNDIVNNFIVAYTGQEQILTSVKRTQVLFHAKRSLQELSYDTLPVLKSQELNIPPSLSLPLPQDYVNYTRVACVDGNGILHTLNPLYGLSYNPTELPIQDSTGEISQNSFGANNLAEQSQTEQRWSKANDNDITGEINGFENEGVYDYTWWKQAYGQRYGLNPETSNINGWFSINERKGSISFSSDLANKLVIIKYISDGLAYDEDTKVPKLAEEAMYMSIMYNIIASRNNVDGGTKAFYKREKYVKTRNAKIRLQNLKLDEIIQVFRGQSKWIKH